MTQGLTYRERLPVDLSAVEVDTDLQRHRSELWLNPKGLTGGRSVTTHRWVEGGLSEESLSSLKGETLTSLGKRLSAPTWLRTIQDASDEWVRVGDPQRADDESGVETRLLRPIRFLIDHFARKAHARLDRIEWTPTADALVAGQAHALVTPPNDVLVSEMAQVCALELQLAVQSDGVPASDSAERSTRFFGQFGEIDRCLEFLSFYPSVARIVTVQLERWSSFVCEFFERLNADYQLLVEDLGASGSLASVAWGEGDSHDGGRSVAILTFSSGAKIVYKPRPMKVDEKFRAVVLTVNNASPIELRAPGCIARAQYGWTQFVDQSPCESEADAREFFTRQGALLATLHFFGATDMHFENIVACGPFPVCIDLETAFQPTTRDVGSSYDPSSVMNVGLLPNKIHVSREDGAYFVETAGLGGRGVQSGLLLRNQIEYSGTDRMRVTRRRTSIRPGRNQARSATGSIHDAREFVEEIVEGFSRQYQIVSELEWMQAHRSLLADLADATMRFIVRPTIVYAKLLSESWHPDLLQDGLDRSFYWEAMASVPLDDYMTATQKLLIVDYEIACLEENDVPVFRCRGDDRHLRKGDGEILVPDFFKTSVVESIGERVLGANLAAMQQHVHAIRAALRA
ncbi:type 2 lanthipeptide synthetase LanM [Herbiconiux sp. P16]|uniref:type 2 lanthipeptide synthetase LanM n=1 Tax=Herbiconiux wuyangfengii TaxID=3342794 RepID=UPI0035B951DD